MLDGFENTSVFDGDFHDFYFTFVNIFVTFGDFIRFVLIFVSRFVIFLHVFNFYFIFTFVTIKIDIQFELDLVQSHELCNDQSYCHHRYMYSIYLIYVRYFLKHGKN